jgi:hypothetical protein
MTGDAERPKSHFALLSVCPALNHSFSSSKHGFWSRYRLGEAGPRFCRKQKNGVKTAKARCNYVHSIAGSLATSRHGFSI